MSNLEENKMVRESMCMSEEAVRCDEEKTTCFAEDGGLVSNRISRGAEITAYPVGYDSVPDFLGRPYLTSRLQWTQSNILGQDIVGPISIAADVVGNAYWTNKLQGFNLLRATVVYKIQINANPFQQGKLYFNYMPCYNDVNALDVTQVAMHRATLCGIRQMPGVELDCRDGVAEIEIPYITPSLYYNIKANRYDWGSYWLTVLSTLQSDGSESTVDVTIYTYLKDVELSQPVVPQMMGGSSKGRKRKVRTTVGRAVVEKEKDAVADMSSLSGALRAAGSIGRGLATVPFLAPIAGPASWVADGLAGVASFFGWSKPRVDTSVGVVARQQFRYGAVADGVDASVALSLSKDNVLSVDDDMNPMGVDEMSFAYLRSVQGFVPKIVSNLAANYTWTTSQTSTTSLLTKYAIAPASFCEVISISDGGHTASYAQGPPIFYLGNQFGMWRGSIDLVIKFAKTDSHTGRLQVTFTPNNFNANTTPDLYTGLLAMRTVVDIRTSNEIRLNLPFMVENSFLSTSVPSGYLDIVVLNELRAPSICSQSIDFLLFFSGGEDFEFANPSGAVSLSPFSPQMGGCDVIIDEGIGGMPIESRSTVFAEHSVGEVFTSVRQLLSRYSFVGTNASIGSVATLAYFPWNSGVVRFNTSTGAVATPTFGGDIYTYIANMYTFYRGGMRVIFQDATQVTTNVVANLEKTSARPVFSGGENSWAAAGAFTANGQLTLCNKGIHNGDANIGVYQAEVPYMSYMKASFVQNTMLNDLINIGDDTPLNVVRFSCPGACVPSLLRSIRDDFQFMYFLSCPPIVVSYA